MRWAEVSAFMPIMRTHECNRPDTNWQFNSDDETLRHFAKMTSVYAMLKPYHIHTGREYTDQGLPPVRHPYIHYEKDDNLHRFKYQYLYGRDLLVAPVYKKGKRSMKVYLPADNWVHLWSGAAYTGGWCTVKAPLGQPPVSFGATALLPNSSARRPHYDRRTAPVESAPETVHGRETPFARYGRLLDEYDFSDMIERANADIVMPEKGVLYERDISALHSTMSATVIRHRVFGDIDVQLAGVSDIIPASTVLSITSVRKSILPVLIWC
jgi:alpha-glucosidase (family GH31 glycosyl hydrolase)